jgi:hypothetical protein
VAITTQDKEQEQVYEDQIRFMTQGTISREVGKDGTRNKFREIGQEEACCKRWSRNCYAITVGIYVAVVGVDVGVYVFMVGVYVLIVGFYVFIVGVYAAI